MRIVSLLPAATEIVGALGLLDQLVGISHECNYPESVDDKPRVTTCEINARALSSLEIDQWVTQKLSRAEDLYGLDAQQLRELQPDLILTQRLCDVCAPAFGSVAALAATLPGPPKVINLEPSTLEDILLNIQLVADTLGVPAMGTRLVQSLWERIDLVKRRTEGTSQWPRVAVIEWLDPVFCSGHWTPQLVEIAGAKEVFGRKGEDSVRMGWADVLRTEPDVLVISCCGQSATRALQDWEQVKVRPEIQALAAVGNGQVYLVDGNAYFSRPGPRVVDTLEILAEIVHPELFAGKYPDRGVIRLGMECPLLFANR